MLIKELHCIISMPTEQLLNMVSSFVEKMLSLEIRVSKAWIHIKKSWLVIDPNLVGIEGNFPLKHFVSQAKICCPTMIFPASHLYWMTFNFIEIEPLERKKHLMVIFLYLSSYSARNFWSQLCLKIPISRCPSQIFGGSATGYWPLLLRPHGEGLQA